MNECAVVDRIVESDEGDEGDEAGETVLGEEE